MSQVENNSKANEQWKLKYLREEIENMRKKRVDEESNSLVLTADEVNSQEAHPRNLRSIIAGLEDENKLLKVQSTAMSQTIRDLEKVHSDSNTRAIAVVKKSKDGTAALEAVVQQKDIENEKLHRELTRTQHQNKELSESMTLLRKYSDEKEMTIKLLKERWQGDFDHQRSLHLKDMETQSTDLLHYKQQSKQLQQQLQSCQYQLNQAKESIKEFTNKHHSETQDMEAHYASVIQTSSDNMRAVSDTHLLEIGKLQEEMDFLRYSNKKDLEKEKKNSDDQLAATVLKLNTSIDQLQLKERDLLTNINNVEQECQYKNDVISQLQSKISSQQKEINKLADADDQIVRLQRKFESEIKRVENKVKQITSERDSAYSDLAVAEANVHQFEQSTEEIRKDLCQIEQANTHLASTSEDLNNQVETLETNLKEKAVLLRRASVEIKTLTMTISGKDDEINLHKKELTQALAMGIELQNTADLVHASANRQEERLQRKEHEISDQTERLHTQAITNQDLLNSIETLKQELQDKFDTITTLKETISKQQQVFDSECTSFHERERSSREMIARSSQDARETATDKVTLQHTINLLQQEVKIQSNEIMTLKEELLHIPKLQEQLLSMRAQKLSLEDAASCEIDTSRSLKRVIQEREDSLHAADQKIQNLKNTCEMANQSDQMSQQARDILTSLLSGPLKKKHDDLATLNAMEIHSLALQCSCRAADVCSEFEKAEASFNELSEIRNSTSAMLDDRTNQLLKDTSIPNEDSLRESLSDDKWILFFQQTQKSILLLSGVIDMQEQIVVLNDKNSNLETLVETRSDWKENFMSSTRDVVTSCIASVYQLTVDSLKTAAALKRLLRKGAPAECDLLSSSMQKSKTTLIKTISTSFTDREKKQHRLTASVFDLPKTKGRKNSILSSKKEAETY